MNEQFSVVATESPVGIFILLFLINNPAASSGVCCLGKVLDSGVDTQDYAPRLPCASRFLGIKPFANNQQPRRKQRGMLFG
jgi:hypothetical protein